MLVKQAERIHRLEKRLATMDDPVARRRIENRLRILRLPPQARIQVLEKRLAQHPNNHQLRVRLERIKARCNAQKTHTKMDQKNTPVEDRIRIIESALERPDAPNRDRLAGRLTLLKIRSQEGPKNRGDRVKRLRARLVLRPDQPELRARLERLEQNREQLEGKLHTLTARGALKRRPLLARMKALEDQLTHVDNAEERAELEAQMDRIRSKLWRIESRKSPQGNEGIGHTPNKEGRHAALSKRVKTLECALNKVDNAEERMALQADLDRKRDKLWRLESSFGGMEKAIIEQDMTG